MTEPLRPNSGSNPWKLATLGILVVLATALITGVVVANYSGDKSSPPETKPARANTSEHSSAKPVVVAAAKRPSAADIEACNRDAEESRNDTGDTIKDALIGAGAGAGVGAAGGAIAGGGKGAGKGAGIGGIVGAAAGTLYGLNRTNQNDERAAQAYRNCMERRGYND